MRWLGIDVGGTFTDLVLYDEDSGRLVIDKVTSTPDDPSAGVLAGIARRAWAVIDPNVPPGTMPLDRRGQSIVAVGPGNRLLLRAAP